MNIKGCVLAGSGALALAGCTTNPLFEQPTDAAFGEANRQTMMAQVVNPDPVYDTDMVTSGDKGAQAVERYREDNVKQPENISTTESVGGNSSGPN